VSLFLILTMPLPSAVSIHTFVFAVTVAGATPSVPAAITIISSEIVLLPETVVPKSVTVVEIPSVIDLIKPFVAVKSAFVNIYCPA
jgi:hypothetical protein